MSKKVESIPIPENVKIKLQQLGIDKDEIDNQTAVTVALYQQALKGNVSAINAISKLFTDEEESEVKVKDTTKEVEKEEKKLLDCIKVLPKEQQDANKEFIHQLAFMSVQIKNLSNDIAVNGVKEKYKNGANQWGYKDRTEVKTYNNMFKNYQSAMKQFNELLSTSSVIFDDGFDDDELC